MIFQSFKLQLFGGVAHAHVRFRAETMCDFDYCGCYSEDRKRFWAHLKDNKISNQTVKLE